MKIARMVVTAAAIALVIAACDATRATAPRRDTVPAQPPANPVRDDVQTMGSGG